jgi:hypothetical protein
MKRALLLAVVLASLVVGGGLVVYGRLFSTASTTSNGGGAADLARAAGDAAVIDAGPAPTAAAVGAHLTSMRGSVQVRNGAGTWHDAVVGAALGADDAVRAGRNADAVLIAGDGVEVRLSPRSELSVRELNEAAARVRLEEGHVTASVDGSRRRVLRVQARGGDAVAESRGGSFGVVTDGTGQLAVAAETGSLTLTAGGATVDVAAGQSSTALAGAAPSAPQATPGSLFLKLGAMASTHTNQTSTTVQGQTAPGAIVRVGETTASADGEGRFVLKVPLQDGRNELAVEVTDAVGRANAQSLPAVVVDRNKPALDAAVRWGR